MDTPKEDNIFYEPTTKSQPQKALIIEKAEMKTLNDYWNTYRNEFLEFLKVGAPPKIKAVSEGTLKDYKNALDKFFNKFKIKNWQDLRNALIKRNMPKPLVNGLGKFLTFLSYHEYMSVEEEKRWRKGIIRKESKPKTAEKFEKAKIENIKAGYKRLMNKYGTKDSELLVKFMFYTGQRMEHSLKALKLLQKDKSLLEFGDNIAYMPMEQVAEKHKQSFLAIMPKWFGEYLLKEIDKAESKPYTTYESRLKKAKLNATAIRTWFSTFLAENKVPLEIINFLTGKVPKSVLAKHYLNLSKLAKEEYKRIVEKFPKL
ncbi:MAG: integrase [Candidatus Heimdallarchaeaceae archaeon]